MTDTTQGHSTSNKYVAFPYKAANELLLFEKLLSFRLSHALSVPKQSLRPLSSLCGWKSQLLQPLVGPSWTSLCCFPIVMWQFRQRNATKTQGPVLLKCSWNSLSTTTNIRILTAFHLSLQMLKLINCVSDKVESSFFFYFSVIEGRRLVADHRFHLFFCFVVYDWTSLLHGKPWEVIK